MAQPDDTDRKGPAGSTADGTAEEIHHLREAAEHGDAEAQFDLGWMYEQGLGGLPKDEAGAVRWHRLAAEEGHAGARNNLGTMYERNLARLGSRGRSAPGQVQPRRTPALLRPRRRIWFWPGRRGPAG
jgi:TPR repeat protein